MGAVAEIVTDNGSAFVAALDYLADRYKINHIRISPYNSQANGIVERRHYDLRESLVKLSDGDPSKWSTHLNSAIWAERTSIQKSTGTSPYFLAHGIEPIFPFDLAEATYLVEPPEKILSTEEFIAFRARMLEKRKEDLEEIAEKVKKARYESAKQFIREHD